EPCLKAGPLVAVRSSSPPAPTIARMGAAWRVRRPSPTAAGSRPLARQQRTERDDVVLVLHAHGGGDGARRPVAVTLGGHLARREHALRQRLGQQPRPTPPRAPALLTP